MPVKPAYKRIAKWEQKLMGEALSVVTGRQKQSMLDYVTAIFPDIEKLENEIKLILDEAAVSTLQNASYLNFGRQVWSYKRRIGGGQLIAMVDVVLNRWVGEGLDRDILERIRNTVFALAAPAP